MNSSVLDKEICDLQNQIFIVKDYLMCLHKRLYLIRTNYVLKTEYEKNEIAIITYETKHQIVKHTKCVSQLENELLYMMKNYFVGVDEVEQEFDFVIAKAKERSTDDIRLSKCIENAQYESYAEKVRFYLNVKNILYTCNFVKYD